MIPGDSGEGVSDATVLTTGTAGATTGRPSSRRFNRR
jgi:hypothetical protein